VSSGGYFQDVKRRIKDSIDIVDLVGRYIPLRRQGRLFVGLCPWHDDTHPSLQVNPERQLFRCWVCNIGGDIFSFLMRIEGIEFGEALQLLAERAGISLRPPSQSGKPVRGKTAGGTAGGFTKTALFQAAQWVADRYHRFLAQAAAAEPARRYLADRGIEWASIEKFQVGFSPTQSDWILHQARNQGISPALLVAIGVLASRPLGGNYDRFCGRVVFPIRDPLDRPVGFGARILPENYGVIPPISGSNKAKYINTPETRLFTKSSLVYGLDLARHAIRQTGRVIVVEGYTDCILAHQAGLTDVVAVLGTALGPNHIQLLRRYTDRIYLLLDGDEAGRRRAAELLELFVSQDVDLRVVTLPAGYDPADYLVKHGGQALGKLIVETSADAYEYARRIFAAEEAREGVHASSRALERILRTMAKAPVLSAISSPLREALILQRLAAEFNVAETVLRQQLALLRERSGGKGRVGSGASGMGGVPGTAAASPAKAANFAGRKAGGLTTGGTSGHSAAWNWRWQQELLEILLAAPRLVSVAAQHIRPEEFSSEVHRRIYEAMCDLWAAESDLGLDRLMVYSDDPSVHAVLVELDQAVTEKRLASPEEALASFLAVYRQRQVEAQLPQEAARLHQEDLAEAEQLEILQRMVQIRRQLQNLGEGPNHELPA